MFLLVDGWLNFRQEFEALEPQVTPLAAQGLSYGVHVVVAANRWAEIRPALKDLLGTRFELRLGDPTESDVDRRVAVNVPAGRPGRGITRDKLHFLVGLPRIDASSDAETVGPPVSRTRRPRSAARGVAGPRRRSGCCPTAALRAAADAGQAPKKDLVPIGVNEDELATLCLDFDAEPHFVAFADGESGKTNMLRASCAAS